VVYGAYYYRIIGLTLYEATVVVVIGGVGGVVVVSFSFIAQSALHPINTKANKHVMVKILFLISQKVINVPMDNLIYSHL